MSINAVLAVTNDYSYKDECQKAALKRGYHLDYVKTMDDALDELLNEDYVLVVIRADTVNYLPLLRIVKQVQQIPILVFTYVEPNDKSEALKLGADVYIASPFSLDYIIESCYALIQLHVNVNKRNRDNQAEILTHEYIRVCAGTRQVFVGGKVVDLVRKEFDVLCLLMKHRPNVLTYEEIFIQVWGEEYADSSVNTLSGTIHRLQKKLSVEPDIPNYISNVHHIGYAFARPDGSE